MAAVEQTLTGIATISHGVQRGEQVVEAWNYDKRRSQLGEERGAPAAFQPGQVTRSVGNGGHLPRRRADRQVHVIIVPVTRPPAAGPARSFSLLNEQLLNLP